MILPPPRPKPASAQDKALAELAFTIETDLFLCTPQARPCAVTGSAYALETLHRLPLADAFYSLFRFLLDGPLLGALFDRFKGKCYTELLTFEQIVRVVADALTKHHGSARQAIHSAQQTGLLDSQTRAFYRKLGRLPLPLSCALLAALTTRLLTLFPDDMVVQPTPDSLRHFTITVIDGKKIKDCAKRLLPTRGQPGKLFGGKILAAYLPRYGSIVAMAADPDGEANDIRLMPDFMPLARAATPGQLRLWVADSQFCDLDQPELFTQEGDRFLLRFTARNSFHPDKEELAREGKDKEGKRVLQEWGWMGAVSQLRRRYVRRITLFRPGEQDVVLVTDLLEEELFPVQDLLDTYLLRWQIENVYQQITEVFGLQKLIGSSPEATVFQASLCLVIYNVLQLVKAYVARGQTKPLQVDEVSGEMLFVSLSEQLISLHTTLKKEELLPILERTWTAEGLRQHLADLLGRQWSDLWLKVKNKKRRPSTPRSQKSGAHSSVHKVLQEAKKGGPRRPPKNAPTSRCAQQ